MERVRRRPVHVEPIHAERIIIVIGNDGELLLGRIVVEIIIVHQRPVIVPASDERVYGKILKDTVYVKILFN